ncbi:MAG TPA: 16S rRNA (cytosine(1402)-N(4))-methyltransferase RsmH [Candidatus Paceibacterota bacterium]
MRHVPVLLQSILDGLNIDSMKASVSSKVPVVIDCNLGDGGHSEEVVVALKGNVHVIGFDLDPNAIQRATANIERRVAEEKQKDSSFADPKLTFINQNFRTLKKAVSDHRALATGETADAILFDLGISSYEIDESGRGFSFQRDEPLSMTFGTPETYAFTAYDIVNTWEEESIADIIYAYGEDTFSRRVAKAIVAARAEKAIETAKQLADIVRQSYPGFARNGRTHPATKTFQALRIAVNDELRSIHEAMPQAVELLKPEGRLAVISFHSLEDRIIKNFFKEQSDEGTIKILTKKPEVPSDEEIAANPRSRSSKLRIAEKLR